LAVSSEIAADVATEGAVALEVLEGFFVEVVCGVRAAFAMVAFLPDRAVCLYGR
jgi:hypothetical protein